MCVLVAHNQNTKLCCRGKTKQFFEQQKFATLFEEYFLNFCNILEQNILSWYK